MSSLRYPMNAVALLRPAIPVGRSNLVKANKLDLGDIDRLAIARNAPQPVQQCPAAYAVGHRLGLRGLEPGPDIAGAWYSLGLRQRVPTPVKLLNEWEIAA